MKITAGRLSGLLLAATLAACQTAPTDAPSLSQTAEPHPGLAFAQGACGGCHAVERIGLSPNPDAPPFPSIVNRDGLNATTLTTWLRDAHNYPQEMDFDLNSTEVKALVEYMLTLQDEAYRPSIG